MGDEHCRRPQIDVRFPTALQITLSLALAEEQSVSHLSSTQLAENLGANPSFVRKLLVPLVQNKLLSSQMGKAGGVRLARPAAEITLRDIYRAVVADTKIWAPRTGVPHRCLVSSNVQGYFEELIDDGRRPSSPCSGNVPCYTPSRNRSVARVRRGQPAKFG